MAIKHGINETRGWHKLVISALIKDNWTRKFILAQNLSYN